MAKRQKEPKAVPWSVWDGNIIPQVLKEPSKISVLCSLMLKTKYLKVVLNKLLKRLE